MRRSSKIFRKRITTVVLVAACLAAAAGCGGSGSNAGAESTKTATDGATGAAGGGLTKVKVGTLAIATAAPLYLGVEHGIFKKHGLDVEIEPNTAGSAITSAVVSGQEQFGGYVNPVSVMLASTTGLPVQILAPGSAATDSGPQGEWDALMVANDSPIDSIADLAGKTVAVNSLNTTETVLLAEVLKKNGVDPGSVKFQEIPFPNAGAALTAHRVDAAYLTEPFVTLAGKQAKVLSYFDQGFGQSVSTGVWISSKQYIADHPDAAKAFVEAIKESNAYAEAHIDEVRTAITDYAKTDPDIATKVKLPAWSLPLDPEENGLSLIAGYMKDQGLLHKPVDFDTLLYRP